MNIISIFDQNNNEKEPHTTFGLSRLLNVVCMSETLNSRGKVCTPRTKNSKD